MKLCTACSQPIRLDGLSWRDVAAEEEERANDNAAAVVAAQAFIDVYANYPPQNWGGRKSRGRVAFERMREAVAQAQGETP